MTHSLNRWRLAASRRMIALMAASACATLTLLALGCSTASTSDAVEKAQIAVRANPALELVATDERQGVLTVRVVRSGQILTVSVNDVVAGTAFRNLDAEPASVAVSGGGGAPDSARVAVSTPGGQASVGRSGSGVEVAASGAQASVRRSGGAAGVAASAGQTDARRPADSVTVSTPEGQVAVRRSGDTLSVTTPEGRVTVGAGSVQVQPDAGGRVAPDRQSPAGGAAAPSDAAAPGAVIDESRLERRTRPVTCMGSNTVDLRNVFLRVDDVAIDTLGACVVRIINSHIVGDVAVSSTGGANVTIENSIIEGRVALALQGAVTMSVRSSTIRGAVERTGTNNLRDLGGNLWR